MGAVVGRACARRVVLAVAAALALAGVAAAAPKPNPLPLTPNDPGWSGQWGLRLMGVPQVWQFTNATVHPVIATVDTGVDSTFPDLRGVVVPGWNLVDNNADTSDTAQHGTDVAIVIAANANNGYGIVGACPMCRVMPVKVSTDRTARPAILAQGIRFAVDHGARIIIVSIVHTGIVDPSEQPAVDYAVAHGAVVIASAGNDPGTTPHYPAALDGVVSVGASDASDALYPWATSGSWVDLTAPGCEYGMEMCGASYAPPLVAAAVGLLVAAGGVTPQQAMDALRATAVPVSGIAGGRVDVLAAARSLGIIAPAPAPKPKPSPATPSPAQSQEIDLEQGMFARTLRRTVVAGKGPLSIVVTRRDAQTCTMTLRSGGALYLPSRTTAGTLSLRTQVAGGTYRLLVTCSNLRAMHYSVLVKGALTPPPS